METAVPIVDQHPASHRTLKVLKDEERHLPAAQEPAATRRDPDAGDVTSSLWSLKLAVLTGCLLWTSSISC